VFSIVCHHQINFSIIFVCSFEQLVEHLKSEDVIQKTKAFVQRIHFIANSLHIPPEEGREMRINIKVILTSFMITYHPNHSFQSDGALEQDLINSAIPLVAKFEELLSATLAPNVSPADLRTPTGNLNFLISRFLTNFRRWKIVDERALVDRMQRTLHDLYRTLGMQGQDDHARRAVLESEIARMRQKLLQIAGINVMNQFDRDLLNAGTPEPVNSSLPQRMSNAQLAHELLLDPSFKLSVSSAAGASDPYTRFLRNIFAREYWTSLAADLEKDPPTYDRIFRVLETLKDGIKDLSNSTVLHRSIDDLLDVEHIRFQIQSNVYDWKSCVDLLKRIFGIMKELNYSEEIKNEIINAATFFHEETSNTSVSASIICSTLSKVFDFVNEMRVENANIRLRSIAPVVNTVGVEYMRQKLTEQVQSGAITLDKTTAGINDAVDMMIATTISPVLLTNYSSSLSKSCFVNFICDQVFKSDISAETVPEILRFDVGRLKEFKQRLEHLASAVVVCTYLCQDSDTKPLFSTCITPVIDHMIVENTSFSFDDKFKESLSCIVLNSFQLTNVTIADRVKRNILVVLEPNDTSFRLT